MPWLKPWFTAKVRQLWLEKEEALRSGDEDRFKDAKYTEEQGGERN